MWDGGMVVQARGTRDAGSGEASAVGLGRAEEMVMRVSTVARQVGICILMMLRWRGLNAFCEESTARDQVCEWKTKLFEGRG